MKQLTRIFLLVLLCAAFSLETFSQRTEDHFVRRRVEHRMDLGEKLNVPLVRPEYGFPNENHPYRYTKGMIASLIGGLQEGKFVAYHPDTLGRALSYDDIQARIQEMNSVYWNETGPEYSRGNQNENENENIDEWPENEWEFEDEVDIDDFERLTAENQTAYEDETDLADFEAVVQFIEDWIFDKVRSDIVYDIKYMKIIWVDPAGSLPDKVLAVFKWDDIEGTMAETQWINRFNEAENRSVKEIFDLRIFNSYLIDVSGFGINSLQEAERWREKLVAFEHHLYSY